MKNWPNPFGRILLVIAASLAVSCGHAEEMSLRQALGNAATTMEQHTVAETSRLTVVSVAESRQYALTSSDRVAGYPIAEDLRRLDRDKSQRLAALLLNKQNYSNVRQRCANKYFHGIRFGKDHQTIEIAFGVPCNQLLVTFKKEGVTEWWGGTLGEEAAKKAYALLK